MPEVGKTAPKKTHAQSVLFKKDQWSKASAAAWLKTNGYNAGGFDDPEQGEYFHFRQFDPDKSTRYRNKPIGKGIVLVVGFKEGYMLRHIMTRLQEKRFEEKVTAGPMGKCPKCGTKVPKKTGFCVKCGKKTLKPIKE